MMEMVVQNAKDNHLFSKEYVEAINHKNDNDCSQDDCDQVSYTNSID